MIKRIDITSAKAFDYLQEQLYLSGKTLANQMMLKYLTEGKVFAYVPEGTPLEILSRFETGGIYPFDKVFSKTNRLWFLFKMTQDHLQLIIYSNTYNRTKNIAVYLRNLLEDHWISGLSVLK